MAKAGLPSSPQSGESVEWRQQIGHSVERARLLRGWSLKELADAVGRDERQVAKWINGGERPQLDALFAVESLRQALVVAIAELAGVEVETVIRCKRTA